MIRGRSTDQLDGARAAAPRDQSCTGLLVPVIDAESLPAGPDNGGDDTQEPAKTGCRLAHIMEQGRRSFVTRCARGEPVETPEHMQGMTTVPPCHGFPEHELLRVQDSRGDRTG